VPTTGAKGLGFAAAGEVAPVGAAKLSMASRQPDEQRMKVRKMRGLKMPDWDGDFFFMELFLLEMAARSYPGGAPSEDDSF
jgi:hypothetical protein